MPCPIGHALVVLAAHVFPDATAIVEPRCTIVHAKTSLRLLTITNGADLQAHAIVDDAGTIVAGGGLPIECTPCLSERWRLADVDGDGRDEVVAEVHKIGHMVTTGDWIQIRAVHDDGTLEDVSETLLSGTTSHYDHFACRTTLRLVPAKRGQVIELAWHITGKPFDCPTGVHRYAWSAGAFREL